MADSSLVSFERYVGNCSSRQGHKVTRIIPHHQAGNLSLGTLGNVMESRGSSATYGIDSNGNIGQYVPESQRPWTTSSWDADCCAVTIEVANDGGAPDWHVSDKAIEALINLCVDICKRNGITSLNYTGDRNGNMHMHKWYSNTSCPGPCLGSKFPYIASEVNKRLNGSAATTPSNPVKPSGELSKYSDEQLADMVIAGKFGNGDSRKAALDSRYSAVQAIVNLKLGGSYSAPAPAKKSIDEIAKEVIAGKWGNGTDRMQRLEAAGYNYNEVQAKVNQLMGGSNPAPTPKMTARQFAMEVWYHGKHGTGAERQAAAARLGVNYAEAQRLINILASGGKI
jgi:uncharacterized protein YkwD